MESNMFQESFSGSVEDNAIDVANLTFDDVEIDEDLELNAYDRAISRAFGL